MDESISRPMPGAFGSEPAFSPDDKSIVFCSGQSISKVSLAGSAPEVICPVQSFPPGLCWTTDNTILLGTYSGPLFRVSANGGTPAPVTTLDSSAGEISHRLPQLLPGGKAVIFTAKTKDMASFDEALIVAERLDNGERKVLVRGGAFGTYISTGHIIYARGRSILAVQFDPDLLEVTGSPVPIETGGMLNNGGAACFSVSENGMLVFSPPSAFADINSISIGWMDRNGVGYPLCDTLRSFNAAALSPDGRKIAAGITSANDDIWMYDITRGLLSRLTFGWGNNNGPIWSPDGKYVIYSAEKGQIANIYRRPWDGSGVEERLTTSSNPQVPVSITPDGKLLSYNEKGDIWIVPLDSSGAGNPYPFIQTPAEETGGSFSPDGKWMAYSSDESGKDEIYVVAFPKRGGKTQISNGGGTGVAFSRDGKELLYGNVPSLMAVDVKAGSGFDFSLPRKVFTIPPNIEPWDISLDGTKFLTLVHHSAIDSLSHLDVVTGWFEVVKSKFAPNKN
jgi:serine/threonine-protein kinase